VTAAITTFSARAAVLPIDNVDTDQIIPARFLKTTDKAGLGDGLFADWRYNTAGAPRADFPLNRPEARGAEILIAGHNFGCGSSREHAAWALLAHGFRAVVSTHFADIFRNNALKNGLLPILVPRNVHEALVRLCTAAPEARLTVDLASQTLELPPPDGRRVEFPIDPFARHCLMHGVDELGFLLAEGPAIARYEAAHPPRVRT
jgi:3-isopropylmalate/(R)-2-methylmalate dehydratase small subunit